MSEARPGRGSEARSVAAPEARLADATWPEVDARTAVALTTLLIPLGATEQHGPHLPLGTDTEIAVALAEAAAADLPAAFVAPALAYGASGEHQHFAGTLSIGTEATELVLLELGRSATETFDRVLFVNAHGGNAAPLAAAVRRLREEGREALAWSPHFGGDAHAGRTETSLLLTLDPATAARGELAEAGNRAPLAELIEALRVDGVRAISPNGVLGDPAGASAAEGRALLAVAVEDLRATVRTWRDAPAPAGGVEAG